MSADWPERSFRFDFKPEPHTAPRGSRSSSSRRLSPALPRRTLAAVRARKDFCWPAGSDFYASVLFACAFATAAAKMDMLTVGMNFFMSDFILD